MRDPGSFRDPSGYVFTHAGRVFRAVDDEAYRNFLLLKSSGAYDALMERGWIVAAEEASSDEATQTLIHAESDRLKVLEHPRVPFISYPYEWPFELLKRAALLHLDVHLLALDFGLTLSDATAYNIQFIGIRPVFIDISSFVPYRDGDYWDGHRQFVEQFANPLLMRALLGVAHNAWYRGALEGIPTADMAALIGWPKRWLSPDVLTNITLPDRFQRRARREPDQPSRQPKPLPKAALQMMLRRLRRWISNLAPKDVGPTEWQQYERGNLSYSDTEESRKEKFVNCFAQNNTLACAWDIGCNTGRYSQALLQNGVRSVIGFDADLNALDVAVARATADNLDFLPLFSDAANPSPGQGWTETERSGLHSRSRADAVIALAIVHHLAIGRNIPLPSVLDWLVGLAPRGVIEFVPKSDPMIQRMLRLRRDIFDGYDGEQFERALTRHAAIVRRLELTPGGRTLYEFARQAGGD